MRIWLANHNRLGQHPRPHLPLQVQLDDAVVAITLIEASAVDSGAVLPPGCCVPTAFEDDPDASFAEVADRGVVAVRAGGLPGSGPPLLGWDAFG